MTYVLPLAQTETEQSRWQQQQEPGPEPLAQHESEQAPRKGGGAKGQPVAVSMPSRTSPPSAQRGRDG